VTNHGVSWVMRHVSWLVVCRCRAWRQWSTARWRSSRDVQVERGSGGLGAWRSRTMVKRVSGGERVWNTLLVGGLVVWTSNPLVAGFTGLGLKTRAEVPRRNGRHVAASRSSRWGEAISWREQWLSDEDYLGLDHNNLGLWFNSKYLRTKLRLCNSPVK
jgi:hypothetical protein